MDIMMVLSTDDVKRLKNKFIRPLRIDEFVFIMMKCLHEHIHNELEFVVNVIELYETIDVNGDGSLEWDEFAGYIVDAGIAKAEEAIVAQSTVKLYSPFTFKGEAANTIQPIMAEHTYIEQLLALSGRQAIVYFDHGSDVVHLYLFGHERDAEPRFASTIRLHTAYQAHKILYIEDISTRSMLAISSVLNNGCITLWDITRLYSPIPLNRIEVCVAQEMLAWIPSHQLLFSTTTQSTYKKGKKDFSFLSAFDIPTLSEIPMEIGIKYITSICVIKRSTRTLIALGSQDGAITIHDLSKESQQVHMEAHERGVKALGYSIKHGYLASIGHYSFAEETTMEVLIWRLEETTGYLEHTLCGHHAALCAISVVDSEDHLISSDELGMFRIWSAYTWECIQVFHAAHLTSLKCQFVFQTTPQADALLVCGNKTVEYHDCTLSREREEFVYVDFNCTFNVIMAVTNRRLILWDIQTGQVKKTYELHVIYNERTIQLITAVCLDDRERKLVLGDDIGQVLVVNAVNGNLMKELDPHGHAITSLSYAANAKCVISTAVDSSIHICDENNAHGYYVPIAGAPLSVLLRSIRLVREQEQSHGHRYSMTKNSSPFNSTPHGMDILLGLVSDRFQLVATLSYCSGTIGESYIQLWDFNNSILLGSCLAPDPSIEISCISFLGDYPGIVAGLSSGDVYVWGLQSSSTPWRCIFRLAHCFNSNAITSILAVNQTYHERCGVFVFAGDDSGRIVRWGLDHETCVAHGMDWMQTEDSMPSFRTTDQSEPDDRAATPSASTRHTHTDVSWDTIAKSVRSAKLLNGTSSPQSIPFDLHWQNDANVAITKLAITACTLEESSLLSCTSSSKIHAWSYSGQAQGTLDYFATRRNPVHEPWRMPVDLSYSQRKKETQAMKILNQIHGVNSHLELKGGRRPRTPQNRALPRHAIDPAQYQIEQITPRTSIRFQTLGQLASAHNESQQDQEDTMANESLDVVLNEISKLNQETSSRHMIERKIRPMKTVESILEKSMSMPSFKEGEHRNTSHKIVKHKHTRTHKMLLPPIDIREEISKPQAKPVESTQSVLSYHMKLAHAWQQ